MLETSWRARVSAELPELFGVISNSTKRLSRPGNRVVPENNDVIEFYINFIIIVISFSISVASKHLIAAAISRGGKYIHA